MFHWVINNIYRLYLGVLWVYAMCNALKLNAQEFYFVNLAEGLKTKAIGTMITDRQGNVWIAGYDGLHKHEGNRIYHFSSSGPNPYRLSASEMHALHEDRDGFIWAGTMKGVDRIDPITHKVVHFPLPTHLGIASYGYLNSIFQDNTDTIWVSTDAALLKLHPKTGQYKLVPLGKGAFEIPSYSLSYINGMKTPKGMWLHTGAGIVFFNFANRKFEHTFHNPQNKRVFTLQDSIFFGNPTMLMLDSSEHIWWVYKNKTLIRYHWPTDKVDSFPLPKQPQSWNCCESLAIDPKGKVWVGFRHGGILIIDPATGKSDSLLFLGVNSPIPSNYVHGIICHPSGSMWVSTDNGLAIINYYAAGKTRTLINQEVDFQNLKYQGSTISAYKNQKLFLPFSNYGYFEKDLGTGSITPKQNPVAKAYGSYYILPTENGEPIIAANQILVSNKGQHEKLPYGHRLGEINKKLQNIPGQIVWTYFANEAIVVFKKSRGKLFIYNKNGISEVVPCEGFMKNVTLSFDSTAIWYVTPDFYLVNYNLKNQQKDSFNLPKKLEAMSCSFSNPRDLTDDGSKVWITSQNGLLQYDYSKDSLVCFSEADGLSHGFTYSLVRDKQNSLWVLSLGGIDYFNRGAGKFENMMQWPLESYMDGFGSSLMLPSGILYFTSGNKLLSIDPEQIFIRNTYPTALKINQVLVNGVAVDWRNGLHLEHDENRIQIRYGLMDFTNEFNAKYSYRLGEDAAWINDDLKGDLQFTELQTGKFTLQLRAINGANELVGSPISLSVTIYPPWYKTWWFRLIISMLLTGIAVYIIRQRIKAIRTKAAIRQELTELESKALRAQMNPHFIFNSLNAIQELVVTNRVDSAYTYLSHFSKLLRLVLNHSEKDLISLGDELQVVNLYIQLESLRFKHSFHYSIKIADNMDTEELYIPPILLQPFIENAIWHGLMHKQGEKLLNIEICEVNDQLQCTITDNGIGRTASANIKSKKLGAKPFESKGTELSLQRVAVLNRQFKNKLNISIVDLRNSHGEPNGTKVILKIPQNQHFINDR